MAAPEKSDARQKAGDQPAPERLDQAIDTWFADSFPGSPVARNTECWNRVHEAVQELKRRLRDMGFMA